MTQQLTTDIKSLIASAKAMRTMAGVDKKWLNKTIGRLEEAEAFSTLVILQGSLAAVPEASAPDYHPDPIQCSCIQGAVDSKCPIHGVPF